ncbi:MAG: 4Fe-4S double cluster binding domain-containing protein [Desulfobacterales bacterium]|jgi:epoxyqueuosine reductase QueG
MRKLEKEIKQITASHGCSLYGYADLAGLTPPKLARFHRGIAFVFQMTPWVMDQLAQGPTDAYTVLYGQINRRIDALAAEVVRSLARAGHQAWALPSSTRSDTVNIRGDFQHKTAATRAGLGWVGKNCQLLTRPWGPWVRLGTVLTDAPLEPATPIEKSLCGRCTLCIDVCPAKALQGGSWRPGVARDVLLDARACDRYKKTHFHQFHGGHNCGICTQACPVGQKVLRR